MQRNLRSQHDYRSTLIRNQLTSLVLYEAIVTTRSKAKLLAPVVNRFFRNVIKADLNAMKLAHSTLLDKNAVKKVFEVLLPRYTDKTNFVRITRLSPRKGDAAEQVQISFVDVAKEQKAAPKAAETKSKVTVRSK